MGAVLFGALAGALFGAAARRPSASACSAAATRTSGAVASPAIGVRARRGRRRSRRSSAGDVPRRRPLAVPAGRALAPGRRADPLHRRDPRHRAVARRDPDRDGAADLRRDRAHDPRRAVQRLAARLAPCWSSPAARCSAVERSAPAALPGARRRARTPLRRSSSPSATTSPAGRHASRIRRRRSSAAALALAAAFPFVTAYVLATRPRSLRGRLGRALLAFAPAGIALGLAYSACSRRSTAAACRSSRR